MLTEGTLIQTNSSESAGLYFCHREVGFEPQICVYHFHKSGIHIFVGGSSSVTVSFTFKMEITKRKYHEESGRRVRIDKIHTVESKKEQKKLNSAAWRLKNPRPG